MKRCSTMLMVRGFDMEYCKSPLFEIHGFVTEKLIFATSDLWNKNSEICEELGWSKDEEKKEIIRKIVVSKISSIGDILDFVEDKIAEYREKERNYGKAENSVGKRNKNGQKTKRDSG